MKFRDDKILFKRNLFGEEIISLTKCLKDQKLKRKDEILAVFCGKLKIVEFKITMSATIRSSTKNVRKRFFKKCIIK